MVLVCLSLDQEPTEALAGLGSLFHQDHGDMPQELGKSRVFKGQRWRKKTTGNVVEVSAVRGEFIKVKGAFGGRVSHSMYKHYFIKYWEPI